MATKTQFDSAVNRHNAECDDDDYSFAVWAPSGQVWADSQTHVISSQYYNGSQSWKPAAWGELIERMQAGTEPCQEINCEQCEAQHDQQ